MKHQIFSAKNFAKILVCDDDKDTRSIIAQSLAASGHIIAEADSGATAMDYCNKELPDLIVMDVMMPEVTGIEFVKWFKQAFSDRFVPVLMLTALSEVEDCVEGLQSGADDYLTKPFNVKELQARVEALLRTRKLTEQIYKQKEALARLNDELTNAQNSLVRKERQLAMLELAGAAAHNLRQPVTTILLKCHLLESEIGKLIHKPEEARSLVTHVMSIKSECDFMNEILTKLVAAKSDNTKNYIGDTNIADLATDEST
ncbi:MAG: response regulator [Deltaproteobacteria bacterium]|nr:response regulator [Deltaproteobacteria bacterium]